MSKIYIPLSLASLAVLAACASTDPATPAPAPVVVAPAPVVQAPPATVVVSPTAVAPGTVVATPTAIRAGSGRVETITALQPSAAAGGTTLRRFGIKMDDGTVQYVDSAAQGISIGQRIELTGDAQIKH
jgi:hypothetical protein